MSNFLWKKIFHQSRRTVYKFEALNGKRSHKISLFEKKSREKVGLQLLLGSIILSHNVSDNYARNLSIQSICLVFRNICVNSD